MQSIKGSKFVFHYVHLLYYKCHKIDRNLDESCIDSLDWIKNKKATINSDNKKDNKRFQCAVTVALHHKKIEKHSEKMKKIRSFINKCNWKQETNFISEKDDWKKFGKINVKIGLNVLYTKKKIYVYCLFQNITRIVL